MKPSFDIHREARTTSTELRLDWEAASADPYAGTVASNGNLIWSAEQAALNLLRRDATWYDSRYGELDDGILTYAFWTAAELPKSYYASQTNPNDYFGEAELATFVPLTAEQMALAEEALGLWDELINIKIVKGEDALSSDITFGTNQFAPYEGAHAFLPSQNDGLHDLGLFYGYQDLGRVSGDVWLNTLETANLAPLGYQTYALQTLVHELGHAFGLTHSGDYNAGARPATYVQDAYFFQDTMQYTTMSYFMARETGAGHVDWENFSILRPSTPMVHDILAVQMVYGADMETRKTDTVYGFNSTADRDVFNFEINTLPVLTIWDAGGNDTLDFSGWDSDSVINLNQGAFSSGGGTGRPTLEAARIALGDPSLTEVELDAILAFNGSPDGMLHDNIAIAYGAIIENAVGGGGNDRLIGNEVANLLDGGAGFDIVSYEDAAARVVVSLDKMRGLEGDAAGDRYVSIEGLWGSRHDDVLSGGNRDDMIDGLDGNDVITGGNGNDLLLGGAGDDQIDGGNGNDRLVGGSGADRIYGGNGNDVLEGGAGSDRLEGGNGNDVLNGGAGDDILIGGNGSDVFVFADEGGVDRILDFKSGADTIDLSAFGELTLVSGSSFSGAAGELLAFKQGSQHFLTGDLDGDGAADFTIITNTPVAPADILFG